MLKSAQPANKPNFSSKISIISVTIIFSISRRAILSRRSQTVAGGSLKGGGGSLHPS
jgi:hypothetical protein